MIGRFAEDAFVLHTSAAELVATPGVGGSAPVADFLT